MRCNGAMDDSRNSALRVKLAQRSTRCDLPHLRGRPEWCTWPVTQQLKALATSMRISIVAHAAWAIPVVLLLLQFVMKLLIFDRPGASLLWRNVVQTPVDIAFLAVSFVAAAAILPTGDASDKLFVLLCYVIASTIVIVLWKAAPEDLTQPKIWAATGLTLLNFTITTLMLVYSVTLLVGAQP